MTSKIKAIGKLPVHAMLNLFDVLVKPILIYGSDVWGIKSKLWDSSDSDKYFYNTLVVCYMS